MVIIRDNDFLDANDAETLTYWDELQRQLFGEDASTEVDTTNMPDENDIQQFGVYESDEEDNAEQLVNVGSGTPVVEYPDTSAIPALSRQVAQQILAGIANTDDTVMTETAPINPGSPVAMTTAPQTPASPARYH